MELCRVYLWLEQKKLTVLECVLQQQPAAVVLLWFCCGSAVVLMWFCCGSDVVLMCCGNFNGTNITWNILSLQSCCVSHLANVFGWFRSQCWSCTVFCVCQHHRHTHNTHKHTHIHTHTHTHTHKHTRTHTHGLSAGLVWVSAVAELIKSLSLCSLFH